MTTAPTTPLADPVWISVARKYLGVEEIKGPHHNPRIVNLWKKAGYAFSDDETPWCGGFVGGVMAEAGYKPQPGGAMAAAWDRYGTALNKPAYGAIIRLWRESPQSGKGHVGFIVGVDKYGNAMVLGGNQGDKVSILPYALTGPKARVKSIRWPGFYPYDERFNLPLLASDGTLASKED